MAAFVTRLQPMMVAHPSRSSATGAIDNSPGGSYRHWPHTHTGRTSFDHLVGAGEERGRNFKAERLRGFKIDNQLKFSRLQYWQVRWLLAFQNPADVDSGLAHRIGKAGPVAYQAVGHTEITILIDCGNRMESRYELFASGVEERDRPRRGVRQAAFGRKFRT